jgi:signal transduction histidine kinase
MEQNYDLIPIPVSIRDGSGRYMYVNNAWTDMFSVSSNQALGATDSDLNLVPLAYPSIGFPPIEGDCSFRDVTIVTRERGRLLLELIETKVKSPVDMGGILCVHQDMTGISWRMDDLSRNLQRAENRSRQAVERMNSVFHDVSEPIDEMLTYCSKLQATSMSGTQKGMVVAIRDNAREIQKKLRLNNDVDLYEAATTSGDEMVCVAMMMDEVVKLYENVARDKDVIVSVKVSDILSEPIQADGARIRQILVNMIESAIRITNKGNVVMEADFRQGLAHPLVLGVSISKAAGPSMRDDDGTGLGLSQKILRGLCAIIGGRLEIGRDQQGTQTMKVFLKAGKRHIGS